MHCLLLWLILAALYQRMDGGLQISPQVITIGSDHDSLERQGHSTEEPATEVMFTCLKVTLDQPPHRPPNEVIWMKDGHQIIANGTKKYRHRRKKKQLIIRDLDEMDSGEYECALSRNSTEKGTAELWIAPRVVSAPSPQVLNMGVDSNATVDCLVTGGVRTIDWWKNRILVASSNVTEDLDPRYTVTSTGSLVISSVERSDRGLYTCVVKNKAGQVEQDIRVKVTNKKPTKTNPPPLNYTIPEEPTCNLTNCVEYSDISFGPLPSLPLPPLTNQTVDVAANRSSPHFTAVPHECIQTSVGYRIILNCSAQGVPTPNVEWIRNGVHIEVFNRIQTGGKYRHFVQMPDGSLMITTVQLTDKGTYTCMASNTMANVSTSTHLEVRDGRDQCGVKGQIEDSDVTDRRKRIVSGLAVSGIDEWPWQVLLEYRELRHHKYTTQFCGGALVRPDWIVTAAHCLYKSGSWRTTDSLLVRVGVHNRTDQNEAHQQLLKVRRYIVHPSYSILSGSSFSDNDIALLELAHPVKPSPHAGTICLPSQFQIQEPPIGSMCTVTGWGRLEHGVNEYPELLHRGHVPLVSFEDCRSRVSYGTDVTRNMLCAGWRDGGSDACQNDSGGPLVCEAPGNAGRWAVYGIVNYGHGCGAPYKYGVYARVKNYMRWMENMMTLTN